MKKAILFTPYADIFSGGERYFYSVASQLHQLGLSVTIAWKTDLSDRVEKYFNLNLNGVIFSSPAYHELIKNRHHRKKIMSAYDLSFWVSDGSIPTLYAKHNYLHYQVPFTQSQTHLKARLKARSINRVICNSRFTQEIIDQHTPFAGKSLVLYPYIDSSEFATRGLKQKIILSVGTIGGSLHSKRQDLLIESFAIFHTLFPDWRLVIIGRVEDEKELEKLKTIANHLPVKILPSVSRTKLLKYYTASSIYWHAAGFGIDPNQKPEKMEHFGISIIESLAAGCTPLCYRGGEVARLLSPDQLYTTQSELIEKTLQAVDRLGPQTENTNRQLAAQFDQSQFTARLADILKKDGLIYD